MSEFESKISGTPIQVDIFNHTSIELPVEVKKILNMGFNSPIGSVVNNNKKLLILTQFESFYQHLASYMEKNFDDEFNFNLVELKNKL